MKIAYVYHCRRTALATSRPQTTKMASDSFSCEGYGWTTRTPRHPQTFAPWVSRRVTWVARRVSASSATTTRGWRSPVPATRTTLLRSSSAPGSFVIRGAPLVSNQRTCVGTGFTPMLHLKDKDTCYAHTTLKQVQIMYMYCFLFEFVYISLYYFISSLVLFVI